MLIAVKKIGTDIIMITDTPKATQQEKEFVTMFSLIMTKGTEVTLLDFYKAIQESITYSSKAKKIALDMFNKLEYTAYQSENKS